MKYGQKYFNFLEFADISSECVLYVYSLLLNYLSAIGSTCSRSVCEFIKKNVSEQFRLDLVCLNANNKQMYKATNNKQHGTFAIICFIK